MSWTDEQVQYVRDHWDEARSVAVIAHALGKTEAAVRMKARRLKLKHRAISFYRKDVRMPGVALPAVRQDPRDEPLELVVACGCTWPIGEPGTPGFRYCNAEKLPGKSYCAEHEKKARPRNKPKPLVNA